MDPVILYGGSSSLAGWSADSCGPDGAWSCHSSDTTWKRTTSLLSKYISAAPSPSSAASSPPSPSSPPFTFHTHVCSRGSLEPEISRFAERWRTGTSQFSVVGELAEGDEDVVEEGGGDCKWIGSQLAISALGRDGDSRGRTNIRLMPSLDWFAILARMTSPWNGRNTTIRNSTGMCKLGWLELRREVPRRDF